MSVAQLGFAVDSAPLVAGTKALKDLTAAAKPAAVAAADLSKAASGSAVSLKAGTAAATDHANAHKGLSTQAMAAQHSIRSMVEQLAMGIPPTQILTGQLNHLSYAASGPGGLKGAFTEALGAFRSFLTPMTLIGGGLAAIGVGAALAVASVTRLALQLDDTARIAGTTTAQMNSLSAAASLKGIDNSDFFAAIDKFSGSVYDAKNNMGGLADVLRANHQRAGDLVQDFGSISNLIKAAAGNTQLQFNILSQSGLPATMQWVRFLSQGKDAIAAQAAAFTGTGPQMDALAAKARDFSERWDTAITNLKRGLQQLTLNGVGWLDQLSDAGTRAIMKFQNAMHNTAPSLFSADATATNILKYNMTQTAAGLKGYGSTLTNTTDAKGNIIAGQSTDQYYSTLGKNAPGNTPTTGGPLDPAVLKQQIQLYQQYIGLLGQQASTQQIIASVQKQIDLYNLTPGAIALTKQQVDTMKQLAVEQAIGVTQIKSQVDAYNVETATIGMSAGAAAQYAAAQNAINEAKRVGRPLTDANIASINSEAAALGAAAQNADTMKFAYTGLVQGPLQALSQAIQNGSNFFDALKKAGISALDALANKLADIAAQNLWKSAFGAGTSTGGGLLGLLGIGGGSAAASTAVGSAGTLGSLYHSGGLVGSEPTAMRTVNASMFATAPRFHTGLMPDEFPAILQKGEGVFTKGQMAAMGGAGNDNGAVHVPITVNIDATGADAAGLARVEQKLADLKANLPGLTVQAVQSAQKRRVLR